MLPVTLLGLNRWNIFPFCIEDYNKRGLLPNQRDPRLLIHSRNVKANTIKMFSQIQYNTIPDSVRSCKQQSFAGSQNPQQPNQGMQTARRRRRRSSGATFQTGYHETRLSQIKQNIHPCVTAAGGDSQGPLRRCRVILPPWHLAPVQCAHGVRRTAHGKLPESTTPLDHRLHLSDRHNRTLSWKKIYP